MSDEISKKIEKAMGETFVGNYLFTPEELNEIYDLASHKLRRVNNERGEFLSRSDYNLVFVAIVNITKDWDSSQEAFFDYIFRKLLGSNDYSNKIYNQIINIVNDLNKKNNIFMFTSYTKKYYATIISHSFAPLSSFESFFDMCWEIYSKDLNEQYEKNDIVYELIASSLYNKICNNKDDEKDFRIGSNIYHFRAGIKGLAIDEHNILIYLLDNTIRTINLLFNDAPLEETNYLETIINKWWAKKELSFGFKDRQKTGRAQKVISDYSKIKINYVLDNGIVKLFVPSIRLRNNFEYEPIIEIKNGDQIFKSETMCVRGSGILMATSPIEYKLNNISFGNKIDISVKIFHCDYIIYDSKNSLKREFIVFNEYKEIISQNCMPGPYFVYTQSFSSLIQHPNDIHKSDNNTYNFYAEDGEILQSKDKTVLFINSVEEKNLSFFANQYNDIIFVYKEEEYRVIDGELYVIVDDIEEAKDVCIRCGTKKYKLSYFSYEKVDNFVKYKLSGIFDFGSPQKVFLFKFATNDIFDSIFLIKFSSISITFDKKVYYGDDEGMVSFSTERFNSTSKFKTNDYDVSLLLADGEIIIHPPILRWKIGNSGWNNRPLVNGFWYGDISNAAKLNISIPKDMNCDILLSNNMIVKREEKDQNFLLGQTLYFIKDEGELLSNITIIIKLDDSLLFELGRVFYKETLFDNSFFIYSENKQILWKPNFIGNKSQSFKLTLSKKGPELFSKTLQLKEEMLKFIDFLDGFYNMKIYSINKSFLKSDSLLVQQKIMLGREETIRYKDKYIEIKQAMLFEKYEPTKIRTIYIDNISFLKNIEGLDCYSGYLYVVTVYGTKKYLNKMSDEFGKSITVNPVRLDIKNENSCYIEYGLEDDFDYDDEFVLSNDGKTTVSSKANLQGTSRIDYFMIEVKDNV